VTLRARQVFPVDAAPIEDGAVTIEGERIASVGSAHGVGACDAVLDLGNAAILPGLVNAHTHLEFSDLTQPLGRPGMAFPDWIRAVVAHRRSKVGDSLRESPSLERRNAVAAGLAESLRGGVTTLGEIATAGWLAEPFGDSPVAATVFFELIGLRRELIEERLSSATDHLLSTSTDAERSWRPGLSPHAPYSVHPQLLAHCIKLARQSASPVAFHLAESRAEIELLRDGSGPFRELLIELGAWDETAIPRGTRPLDYLKLLARAPRALVIHGNYLAEDEIAELARQAATMSLVYCPRTHAYFGHEPYPLARLLERGVNVALGTDSRASNPDLSLLGEMRHVAARGDVPPATAFRLGTLNGAKALGLDHQIGSITAGKQADLCVMNLPEGNADPYELLLGHPASVLGVVKRGNFVYADPVNPLASRLSLGMICK
jgi:cytosine/adenosine deaminase-related metal-dependent hydrolase